MIFIYISNKNYTIKMGQYIKPISTNFLNLSGGTVTGDTYFTQSLSATTIISGTTNLYDIFNVKGEGGSTIHIQPGLNTYTAGTTNSPSINISSATLNQLTVSGESSLGVVSATTIADIQHIDFDTNISIPSPIAGRVYYDKIEESLSYFPYTDNMDVILNIGQEELVKVYNNSGNIIYNGQACHINGSEITSGTPTVVLADASNNSIAVVSGIATHDIPNNEHGFITKIGIVRNLSITGITPGTEIYLSDTNPGEFTYSIDDIEITSRTCKIGIVITTGNTISKILVDIDAENVEYYLTNKERNLSELNNSSTGIIKFSWLSANTYDNSKFDLGPIKGWIVDNTTDSTNPTARYINYEGSNLSNPSGITLTYLSGHPVTYIGISGNTTADIVQSIAPFISAQWRDIIKLGVVVHSNNVSIITTNIQPNIDINPILQFYDLAGGLGKFNMNTLDGNEGNVFSSNGANLKVNKTSGRIFSIGSNYLIDPKNPHIKDTASGTSITFRYRLQNSTEYPDTTNVDPNNYDNNGTLTSVPLDKYTIQRAAIFESNLIRWQYGQNLYDSIDDAEAEIPTENFISEPNIFGNGLVRAFVIVKQGTTDLTNSKLAKFVTCGKWGLATETIPGNVHRREILNSSSTGLREGGMMTTGSSLTFNVLAGSGIIINNNDSNNPVFQEIIWSAKTGNTLTYLTGDVATFIMIDNTGEIIQFPFSSSPTQSDKRNKIFLGVVAHSNRSYITNIYNYPIHFISPVNQHEDLTNSIGPFNISGNFISGITGTIQLQKTLGTSYMYGSNFQIDNTSPSTIINPPISGASTPDYQLVYAKGTTIMGMSGYSIDITNYNPNGTANIVPLTNKYFTTHRIWILPIKNLLVFQYGQTEYKTMADAINSLDAENYIAPPSLNSFGYLLSILITQEGTIDLTDTITSKIIPQSKFAGTGGGGGMVLETLQTVYNNSLQPEILTDGTRGAVDFRVGSGSDSDNVLTIQNSVGNINAVFKGNGYLSATTISGGIIVSGNTNLYNIFSQTGHTHSITDVNNLSNSLDTKANLSGATFSGQISALIISATTLSASTIYSATTNLYNIFISDGDIIDGGIF